MVNRLLWQTILSKIPWQQKVLSKISWQQKVETHHTPPSSFTFFLDFTNVLKPLKGKKGNIVPLEINLGMSHMPISFFTKLNNEVSVLIQEIDVHPANVPPG